MSLSCITNLKLICARVKYISLHIGEWVIDSALAQLGAWHAAGINLSISVNISASQLQQHDFVTTLLALLNKHPEVNPGKLELEILETSALENFVDVSNVIRACCQMGIQFALDDFGTGYSSLTYLKRLPVSILKIDQTFVRDMLDDPDDLTIVKRVETVAHGAMLLSIGCELAQGYGIARPMPAEDIPVWMDNWNKNTDLDFFRSAVHQPSG